ncbi:MAG TPA: PDZ domain-containing protein [Polyangia bacterium]|jgi:membrane-associated protease RseP (regulator of RpoE activity)
MGTLATLVVLGLVGLGPAVALLAHVGARRAFRVPGLALIAFQPPPAAAAAPLAARLAVRATGPVALYAYAVLLVLIGVLVTGGAVQSTRVEVLDGPARAAGVRDGDRVLAVDGAPVADFADIRRLVAARRSGPVAVRLERDGGATTVTVTPDAAGRIGVRSRVERTRLPLAVAARHAVTRPVRIVWTMCERLARGALSGRRAEVGGPIAIAQQMKDVSLGAAVVYAGDVCGWGWPAYLLVALAAAVIGEAAERQPRRGR